MDCGDTAVAGTTERRTTYQEGKLSAAFAADNEVDMKEKRQSLPSAGHPIAEQTPWTAERKSGGACRLPIVF